MQAPNREFLDIQNDVLDGIWRCHWISSCTAQHDLEKAQTVGKHPYFKCRAEGRWKGSENAA